MAEYKKIYKSCNIKCLFVFVWFKFWAEIFPLSVTLHKHFPNYKLLIYNVCVKLCVWAVNLYKCHSCDCSSVFSFANCKGLMCAWITLSLWIEAKVISFDHEVQTVVYVMMALYNTNSYLSIMDSLANPILSDYFGFSVDILVFFFLGVASLTPITCLVLWVSQFSSYLIGL